MKKVLALLVVSTLILLLAACGNNQIASTPAQEATTAVTEQVQATQSVENEYPITGNIVYFKDTLNWSDGGKNIYVHYWSNSNTNMVSWPGNAMTSLGNNVYSYELPDGVEFVIFSNNGDKDTQTRDIIYDGSVRKFQASSKQDDVKAHYATDWDGKEIDTKKIEKNADSDEASSSEGDKVNVEALKKIEESDTFKVKVTKKEIQEDGASGFSLSGNDLIILHITNNDSKPVSDVSVYVLAYDDNNIAQTISTGTYSFGNGEKYIKGFVTNDVTIEPGETTEVAIKTTKGSISGIRCIVDSYKMDGEEIENDLTTDWYKQVYVGKNKELD